MKGRLFLLPVLASVLLTACVENQTSDGASQRSLGLDYGNAIRQNEALQIVDPRSATADKQAPALDGRRAAAAMARYQNGAVRALEIERTAKSKAE